MQIITSWDDGTRDDLRIAELLRKYQLQGIFFLPNIGLQLTLDEICTLAKDFEIGGHTVSHPEDMKKLGSKSLSDEVELNKKWLEDIINKKLEWFCYPSGRYNEKTIEAVKKAGYKYARTTLVGNIDKPDNLYRIKTTVHVKTDRKEYNKKKWLNYAIQMYKMAESKNGYYHLWGHSLEISEQNLWEDLEKLLRYIYERNINNRD